MLPTLAVEGGYARRRNVPAFPTLATWPCNALNVA